MDQQTRFEADAVVTVIDYAITDDDLVATINIPSISVRNFCF